MKPANLFMFVILGILIVQCNSTKSYLNKRNIDFNEGWRFLEDSTISAIEAYFDDSKWRIVNLPHDWSVEDFPVQDSLHIGPFYKAMQGGHDVGYLRGGTGWYRKKFMLKPKDADKQMYIYFDGVQVEMTLWVNSKEVGNHVYGYTPFYFNITPFLNAPGEENQVTVKVVKPEQNSRWFTGAGIYRSVSLQMLNPVHVDIWGVSVVTSSLSQAQAEIDLTVSVVNQLETDINIIIKSELLGTDGAKIAMSEKEGLVPEKGSAEFELSLQVDNPKHWDTESPNLYKAVITVLQEGNEVDQCVQTFGIRTIKFSAEKGFLLNGKP
ncbi:MAG: beta galactosidase jelly roll domain-containing protein, partial [bacterium]